MTPSVRRFIDNIIHLEEWNVGIIYEPISVFLECGATPKIHWFPPPERGKYFADPFLVARNGKAYVFCEEFDYRIGKGKIVSFDLTETPPRPEVALDLPIHVSYPYMLEHEGIIYCVPETSRAREIGLYRARNFPYDWRKVATLVSNFPGVDSTVFRFEGRWWLACSHSHRWETLFLWHSGDLTGPWIPHEANPVKADIHSSRPAGTPFMHNGWMYRPAQDCSSTYGGRIIINRVLVLTPTLFREKEVRTIEPQKEPYPKGMHTISSASGVTAVDGKRFTYVKTAFELESNLKAQARYLMRKFRTRKSSESS